MGSGVIPSCTATSMPCAASARCSGSTSPSFTSTASVMIMTRRYPNWPIIRHRRNAESGPTSAVGRGIGINRGTGFMNGLKRR